MLLHGLTENHERSLLASVQYAARLIRDCDDVLVASDDQNCAGLPVRLKEQIHRAMDAVGLKPPTPSIGAVHALSTTLMFLDNTFEEMRGKYLRGYGEGPPGGRACA